MRNHHNIDRILGLEKIKTTKMRRASKNRRDMKKNQMEKFGIEIPRNVRPTRPHTGRYKQKQRMV